MGNPNEAGKGAKKEWLPYLVRGILGIIIAANLIQFVFVQEKGPNFPMYMGVFFLFNGILSFNVARAAPIKSSGLILAALTSIIGGLVLVIVYPFSPYRNTLVATDLGRYVFGAIVIIIGLLQFGGALHMTPEPVVKQAHRILGLLEVLLGVVIMALSVDWVAITIGFVWVTLVSIYMFYVAHRLRSRLRVG